jgi:hypothetical protein
MNRLRRFELFALGTIVVAIGVQSLLMYRFVPTLTGMYAGFGLALSRPLELYLRTVTAAAYALPLAMLAWVGLRMAGRALPITVRGVVLCALAAIGCSTSIAGLYFVAEDSLVLAMRLTISGPSQVIEHDLVMLQLAAGDAAGVTKSLDPQGDRDDFVDPPRWTSAGQAFQLAEAYRAQGDLETARRLYRRAQEAAVKFDEVLTTRQLARQVKWESAFGPEVVDWAPSTSRVKQLPDLVRVVSKQRLDQLDGNRR